MVKMSTHSNQLMTEENRRAAFLMEVEYTMQQIGHGHISMNEGYEQLLTLMGKKEVQQIINLQAQLAAKH